MSNADADRAFLAWLDSPAGRELTSTRKGMLLIHELAVDAALAVRQDEEKKEEKITVD